MLVLVLCYQPIIVLVVKMLAPGLAAKQGLKLNDFQLGGTLLTSLRIENLRVSPTRPGPVEKANVGTLELHYSLIKLIRGGLNADFIQSLVLHDADVVYDPSKSPPSKPKKKEPFSLPPLPLPDRVSIRNVSFLMRPDTPEGARASGQAAAASAYVPAPAAPVVAGATTATASQGLLVSGATLELDPEHSGEFKVAELRIPGGLDLTNVHGLTSYRQRDLQVTDLTLAPDIHFRSLNIDGSKLEQQLLALTLEADLFKGHAGAAIHTKGISTPPEASVQIDIAGLSLPSVKDFLHLDAPVEGTLDNLSVRFDGNTNQPRSWTGKVEARLGHPSFGGTALDSTGLRVTFRNGTVQLEEAGGSQGENKVALSANLILADKMSDLPRSTGHGTLEVNAPDFTKLPVKLPLEIHGGLHAGGDFTLADGKLSTTLKGHVQALNIPAQRVSVAGMDFAFDTAKVLPADATAAPTAPGAPPPPHLPFYDKLQTRVAAVVDQVRVADYAIDGVKLTLTTDQDKVKLEQIEITRGKNVVNVDGTYLIPEDFAAWQKQPLDVRLNVAIPDLNGFSADPKAPALPLQGQVNANGSVQMRNGVYGGGFDLQARDVQARGATIRTADVQIALANSHATVRTGHIVFDDKNVIDLSGNGSLQAPFPFDAGLSVDLADLSRFNDTLAANGVNKPLAGSLKIAGKAGGHLNTAPDANDQKIDGSLTITGRDLAAQGIKIASVDTQVDVAGNRAVIKTGQVRFDPKTGVDFSGQADLNAPHAYEGKITGDVPDLGVFTSLLQPAEVKEKVGGSIHLAGQAKGRLASKPDADDQELTGSLDLTARDLQAKGAKLERADVQIVAANDQALIKTFQIHYNDKNTIDVTGQAGLKTPYAYQANLNVNLQDIAAFSPLLRSPEGRQNAKAAKIEAAAGATTPPLHELNGPPGHSQGSKTTLVTKTKTRSGPVTVAVKGAPTAPGTAEYVTPTTPKLGGSLVVQWQAQGNFAKAPDGPKYSGGGKIAAHQVEFNTVGPLEANIEGKYSQQVVDFPTLFVASNGLEFRSVIALKDALARVDKISLKQGPTELLAGYIQIPLDLSKLSAPDGPVPDVDKIDVNIASKPLPLETLFGSVDKTAKTSPPVRGTVQLQIDAHGSLSKIVADVKVAARGIRGTEIQNVKPVDADLALTLHDNRLDLDTSVRQPQIQPLTIKGNLPVDLHAIAQSKQIDPKSPVTLRINLPRADLGFLAGATKAIRFIQGTAAADIRVDGTIEKPTLAGSADLNIVAARAESITVPSIRDFAAHLAFTEKELRIERFAGEIGGGKLNVGGRVTFAKLSEPVLDITASAHNVLAVRDDNITVRVNADAKLAGPLATASVTGTVGLTKSRYLKDIDILPINTPGKPAPAPPAAAASSAPASFGASSPPVSNWNLNVAIRTDDPFFVRGNLANGTALVDLHLKGTGGKPLLDGNVNIQNLVASLPFSRLEISDGNILFTPDQPLNPALNLTGTSTIRNYLVTVFITGRSNDPKVTFTSDPPLAQEQIVSLLATGATTDELAGSGEALAGKATLLVLQDLYRRTFKPKHTSVNAEPQPTLADRLNLNVGDTDPATGKQQVGASYKITDQVQFIADLGIQGDLRGRVKYLIRFR